MQTITLMSSDGKTFDLKEAEAAMMQTFKHMIEVGCAGSAIPVPNVTGEVLAKVIEYCKKHAEDAKADDLRTWDTNFIDVDQAALYDLIMAANYLDIKGLLDLTCQKVADMIKGKSPEQIRQIFHIKNDFTAEEEEEIRAKNRWAFE